MTTAQAVVESLIRHGLDTIYALPGFQNDHLFDALYGARERLRVIHPRHEQAAGYMALGAALATGKPQAFAVVPGPGFLNAATALLHAHGLDLPVLGLVGQIPQADIDRGFGHLHELHDQLGLARHMTKYTARIAAPHEAPRLVSEALHSMCSGRRRPAVLECAMDVWGRAGEVRFPPMPLPIEPEPVDAEAVEAAAKVLGAAQRPLIVVGGGARNASREVTALAEMLEAPVVSYRGGRGVVSTSHRLEVNWPVGHRLWAEADVVLGIGTRLHRPLADWGVDRSLQVVRVDIDPEEVGRFQRPAAALIGDAVPQLQALLERLPRHNRSRASRADELAGHRRWLAEKLAKLEPQMSILKAIRAALPEHGMLVDEVTQIGFAARLALPVERPRTFLCPGYQDNLGWGYGAALGVKAALPDTPVVAISGDGGFLYQMAEMATAVRHKLAVVAIVFDDGAFGNVKRIQQTQFGNRTIASELANPDFVKLAESFGMAAFRATDPAQLQSCLRQALELDAPALIHYPCGSMPNTWDLVMLPRVRG